MMNNKTKKSKCHKKATQSYEHCVSKKKYCRKKCEQECFDEGQKYYKKCTKKSSLKKKKPHLGWTLIFTQGLQGGSGRKRAWSRLQWSKSKFLFYFLH